VNLAAIQSAMMAAAEGKIPEGKATVSDCLVHLLSALLEAYMLGQGRVGQELEALALALENPADPTMRSMGLMERSGILTALSALNHAKEQVRAQQADQQ
jgi:hypothetical protein